MKTVLSILAIAASISCATVQADEGHALQQTEINLQGVAVNKNDLATLKGFNEQPTLVKRAEFLSANLYGNPNTFLDGLPEDPFQRISHLVSRVNAAKNLWIKMLEAREAEVKLHEVAKTTNAPNGFGEITLSKS